MINGVKGFREIQEDTQTMFSLIHRVQYVSSEFSYCMCGRVVWSESILTVIQYIMSTQKNYTVLYVLLSPEFLIYWITMILGGNCQEIPYF